MSILLGFLMTLNLLLPPHPIKVTERYVGPISHFFTHCLIAYPELGLAKGNPMAPHYDNDCVTPEEFRNFLTQVHRNGYVLTDIRDVYRMQNGRPVKRDLFLEKGKKPLILSFDDVVYDRKKAGMGMCDRLTLDEEGRLCSYTERPPRGEQLSYDREFVPILEEFIRIHPDFSPTGARGVLFLTGYDGILGYRTNRDSEIRKSETQAVKPVIGALKEAGWVFGCHSYGHYHMLSRSEHQTESDAKKWNSEVAPLVGKTDLYAYPYGEWDKEACSKRQSLLEQAGFRFFFGVGAVPYFAGRSARLMMDRQPLDGLSLRKFADTYRDVFDAKTVLCR